MDEFEGVSIASPQIGGRGNDACDKTLDRLSEAAPQIHPPLSSFSMVWNLTGLEKLCDLLDVSRWTPVGRS
jgi:hypothetical protein